MHPYRHHPEIRQFSAYYLKSGILEAQFVIQFENVFNMPKLCTIMCLLLAGED